MLEEMSWRIGLFQNHPEVLPRLVPFATPPFYANSDDQTLLNDAIVGAVIRCNNDFPILVSKDLVFLNKGF